MRSFFRMRARMLAAGVLLVAGLTGCWNNPVARPDLRGSKNIPKTNLNPSNSTNPGGNPSAGFGNSGANLNSAPNGAAGSGAPNMRTTGLPADNTGRVGMTSGAMAPPPGVGGSPPYFNQQPPVGAGGVQPIATSSMPGVVKSIQPVANFGAAPLSPPGGALDPVPSTLPVRGLGAPAPISTQNLDQQQRFQRTAPAIPPEGIQLPSPATARVGDSADLQPLQLGPPPPTR